MSTVIIRQTLDPFVDDVQYIAFYKATLTPKGHLDLSTVGVDPKGKFILSTNAGRLWYSPQLGPFGPTKLFNASFVKEALSDNPILTIIDLEHAHAAAMRNRDRNKAQDRAENVAFIKGMFSHVGSRILSVLDPLIASHNHATHTSHISHSCNPNTQDDPLTHPHLEEVTSATAKASYIATTSTMVNRKQRSREGYALFRPSSFNSNSLELLD